MLKKALHNLSSLGIVACFFIMIGTVGGLDAGTIDIKTAYIKGIALIAGLAAMCFLNKETTQDFGE